MKKNKFNERRKSCHQYAFFINGFRFRCGK